jgi:hypothetical protein
VITLDYTPEVALRSLMAKLTQRDSVLAERIQAAMDEGKDIDETELVGTKRKKRRRVYRKAVAYTDKEALKVALNALQAYFIEQPLFVNSLHENMAQTVLGEPRRSRVLAKIGEIFPLSPESEGVEKIIAIELHTETQLRTAMQITSPNQETQDLPKTDQRRIEEQQQNLSRLRELIDFGGK